MHFSRLLIAYVVAVPLALLLGYLVATPDMMSIGLVGMALFFLTLPILIQWHHELLILCWNAAFVLAFIPGEPHFWVVLAGLSFGISMVNFVMGRGKWLKTPQLTWPLLVLMAVIVIVGKARGVGLTSLGSASSGGRRYVFLMFPFIGYFALTARPAAARYRKMLTEGFFLSQTTFIISNLILLLGPAFYILYYFFPSGFAEDQANAEFGNALVGRYSGLAPLSVGLICFALGRWGLRGVLQVTKPWRFLVLLGGIATAAMSGYRNALGFAAILLVIQFMVEGLWKTRYMFVCIMLGVLVSIPVLVFSNKLPLAVQRTISFLPVDINPEVRYEAEASTEWRFDMWRDIWPDVPQYLFLGKGYSVDSTEAFLVSEGARTGLLPGNASFIENMAYHSGPFSTIIPLGLPGALAFVWLLVAGTRVLYLNFRNGDPEVRRINAVLLTLFIAQILRFLFIFGDFEGELYLFTGVLGLSVSLNRGVAKKRLAKLVVQSTPVANRMVVPA